MSTYCHSSTYMGTSLTRKRTPLGPYRRPVLRVLGESLGGMRFLMREVPLYRHLSTYRWAHEIPLGKINSPPALRIGPKQAWHVSLFSAVTGHFACASQEMGNRKWWVWSNPDDIPQKVLRRSFCTSQFPHKSVNVFFILVIIMDKLTNLCGS